MLGSQAQIRDQDKRRRRKRSYTKPTEAEQVHVNPMTLQKEDHIKQQTKRICFGGAKGCRSKPGKLGKSTCSEEAEKGICLPTPWFVLTPHALPYELLRKAEIR